MNTRRGGGLGGMCRGQEGLSEDRCYIRGQFGSGCPGSEVEELRLVMDGLEMGNSGDGSRSCRCRGWPVAEVNGDVEVVRGGLEEQECDEALYSNDRWQNGGTQKHNRWGIATKTQNRYDSYTGTRQDTSNFFPLCFGAGCSLSFFCFFLCFSFLFFFFLPSFICFFYSVSLF